MKPSVSDDILYVSFTWRRGYILRRITFKRKVFKNFLVYKAFILKLFVVVLYSFKKGVINQTIDIRIISIIVER